MLFFTELLYTAEEMNAEEPSKGQKEKKVSKDSKTNNKVSTKRDHKQRTTSPILPKRRKSLSKSPCRSPPRRRRTPSRSPSRRRRTPSRSPIRRRRTLSKSPARRHRTSSRSPLRRKSRSPFRRRRTLSRSPQRRKSRSRSVHGRKSRSRSSNRGCRTRTRSPQRHKTSSQSPQRHKTSSKSPTETHFSIPKPKIRSKSVENNEVDKPSEKEASKKQDSPIQNLLDDKVVDARELLNRKKAARELGNKNTSRSRSRSPVQKKRDDRDSNYRSFRDDKDSNRRTAKSNEPRITRDDDRDRKSARDRDLYPSKRREDRQLYSERFDSKKNRKREPSDPPSKRVTLERSYKNKNDHWESAGTSKTSKPTEGSRLETDSSKRRESEVNIGLTSIQVESKL